MDVKNNSKEKGKDISWQIVKILDGFHAIVFKILRNLQTLHVNNPDIDWLRQILGTARDVDPLFIIERCKDKIWSYKDQIIARDDNFFINETFGKFIKEDKNKEFINTLMHVIKLSYLQISEPEQKEIWNNVTALLKYIIEYRKLSGDYVT